MLSYSDRLKIKHQYEAARPWEREVDPYSIWPYDWLMHMTPIERNVWSDIRYYGLKFYPQYPIDRYFVDFADPMNKIVIEADGKDWHSTEEQQESDLERQRKIESIGYLVLRVKGKHTFLDWESFVARCTSRYEELDSDERAAIKQRFFDTGCSEAIMWQIREYLNEEEH